MTRRNMRKGLFAPGLNSAVGNVRIPGQAPKLLLRHSQINSSAIKELTKPAKAPTRPTIPGSAATFRTSEAVLSGLPLDANTQQLLQAELRQWVTTDNVLAFRKSLMQRLREIAPKDFDLRMELGRRAMSYWKAAVDQRFDRRPGREGAQLIVQKSDPLVKSGPHKYLRKYVKNGKTVYVYADEKGKHKHRYHEDDAYDRMIELGDRLYEMQETNPLERDNTGFNRFDMTAWPQARGNAAAMKRVLAKYKRQIGEEEHGLVGLGDREASKITIAPEVHPRWKSLMLPLNGRVAKKDWQSFLAANRYLKEAGARFDGATKTWFVPQEKISDITPEIWAEFTKKMAAAGVTVGALPKVEAPVKKKESDAPAAPKESDAPAAPGEPTVDEVIDRIRNKHPIPKTIGVRRDEDGMFHFFSPFSRAFNEVFSNRAGMISGITEYDPRTHARKTYDLDLVEEAIEKLQSVLPDWKIVTGGVKEAQVERDAREAELRKPIPEVAAKIAPGIKLFPYQNEAVRFLVENDGKALIGDEMGLGKTAQSLAYIASQNKRALVVVPKVVRRTWLQEAEKFFPDYFKGHTRELISSSIKKDGQPDLTNTKIAAVNYESLQKFLPAIKAAGFDTIVVDESHRIKSPKAKITRTISALRDHFKHRILLSGTAVKNKKEELHTQVEFIQPGLFKRSELQYGTIGGIWNKLKRSVYIARQKRQVLPDLPEKTTQITEHHIPGMPGFPSDIGEMSEARVSAALAKAPISADFVKETLKTSDSSVLVFTESKTAAEEIAKKLGDVAILHHGQMSDDKREAAKAEFQREGTSKRVFVSTRQSLAVGATLTAADKVVFNDIPWTAADLRQAEDRAHRVGQKNNVNVYWMTASDSDWDRTASDILLRKYELNRKINEGRQLTAEERKWMTEPVKLAEIRNELAGQSAGPKVSDSPPAASESAPKTPEPTGLTWGQWLEQAGQGTDRFRQIESLGGYKEARKKFEAFDRQQQAGETPKIEKPQPKPVPKPVVRPAVATTKPPKRAPTPRSQKKKESTKPTTKPRRPAEQLSLFGDTKKSITDAHLEMLRPRLVLRPTSHPLELVWMAEELPDQLHEQFERKPPGWPSDDLNKGAGHKYLRRIPTGKPKPKYTYIYRVPQTKELVADDHLVPGSKFKIEHGGQLGHFEVRAHDPKKGIVTLRHDESGRTVHMRAKDLPRLMQRQVGKKTRKQLEVVKPQDKLKLRREGHQQALPGTGRAEQPAKQESFPEPKKPVRAAPALPRMAMSDLGKGGYDNIEGFAADARELETQAHAMKGQGRTFAIIPQVGGFVLASKPSQSPGGRTAVGDATSVFMRGGSQGSGIQSVKAEYVLMEASDVVASHDPESFSERTEYPEGVQERRYHAVKAEQGKIDRIARSLEPAVVINSNPDAINGAPVVTEDGVVLGGNGRTMGMQRAYKLYPESAKKMKDYLAQHARAFGLSPQQVAGMKHPILVRQMSAGKDTDKLRALGRRMNEALTQGLDPRSAEVALGKNYVTTEVLDSLAHNMEGDESLGDFLRSSRAKPFQAVLERAGIIDEFNRAEFVDSSGQLNEDGRLRVERVLAARMLPDATLLSQMGQALRQNIAKATPHLIRAESHGWDLRGSMMAAVKADVEMRTRGAKPNQKGRELYLRQQEIGGAEGASAGVRKDPVAQMLLTVVQDHNGARKLPQGFKQFALEAGRQEFDHGANVAMFAREKVDPDQALRNAFKIKAPEQQEALAMSLPQTWGDRLIKAKVGTDGLVRYVMHAVNWELESLMRAAIGALKPGQALDGQKVLSRLQAFVVEQAYQDLDFARGLGVHPLDSKVLEGLIQAHARSRVTDIAKALAKSSAHSNFAAVREGSRGGKVVGHTASGRPIYSHSEASKYHRDRAQKMTHLPGASAARQAHVNAASAHAQKRSDAFKLSKQAHSAESPAHRSWLSRTERTSYKSQTEDVSCPPMQ